MSSSTRHNKTNTLIPQFINIIIFIVYIIVYNKYNNKIKPSNNSNVTT